MNIIDHPSPNFSTRTSKIDSIILHYTGMTSIDLALKRMCDTKAEVSAHYCISRGGEIYKIVGESKKAWHAGLSFWRGKESLNNNSIGIEIENLGHEHGYQNFPKAQMKAIVQLCQNLIAKYNIKPQNIAGHSDIAPERKEDPGEFFDWRLLAENGIGIYHDIVFENAEYENIREISEHEIQKLSNIGYKIIAGEEYKMKLITAFYRRFFLKRLSLSKNKRYPENIAWDRKAEIILNSLHLLYKEAK